MPKETEKNAPSDNMTPSELVALGKRNMACHDISNAIACYARACSKIAKEHGPLSTELADPSYLYGRALLEAARLEGSALEETAVPGQQEEESSDDEPDQSAEESEVNKSSVDNPQDSSNIESNQLLDDSSPPNQVLTGQEDTSYDQGGCSTSLDQSSVSCDQEGSSHDQSLPDSSHDQSKYSLLDQEGSSFDQSASLCEQEDHDQGEGQEITRLQLAWEVIELSRVILSKQDTREAQLQKADVIATLGEIALESDTFEQAIKDFTDSLEIRTSLLPSHDRSIAELHFQLGLAHTLVKDYDSAIQAYQKARNTLKGTIEHLRSVVADGDATPAESESCQKEIKELEELLPDLDSKIEDVMGAKKELFHNVMSCMQDGAGPSTSFGACSSASVSKAPATDISHLVRKRPAARDTAPPESDAKRSKLEETSAPATSSTAAEQ